MQEAVESQKNFGGKIISDKKETLEYFLHNAVKNALLNEEKISECMDVISLSREEKESFRDSIRFAIAHFVRTVIEDEINK